MSKIKDYEIIWAIKQAKISFPEVEKKKTENSVSELRSRLVLESKN